jgi:dienelactone hydrolase
MGRHRRITGYLAVPDGKGPFPAALLLHDHGAFFTIGKEKMIRPLAGNIKPDISRDWMDRNYEGHSLGDDLAGQGWVVFAADALGWGDRDCGAYENQQAVASNLFNLGSSWAGLIAVEDMTAAAYLASLRQVDPGRVAAIGLSMGGFRSWQVSSLSDHVCASVSVCCFAALASLMQPGGNRTRGQSAFATTHPGIFRMMDIPDLAAIAAPKPMLMIHGTDDHLFPKAGVVAACGKTAAVYRAFGREDRFRSIMRPGGHAFTAADQDTAWAWLHQLGMGPVGQIDRDR